MRRWSPSSSSRTTRTSRTTRSARSRQAWCAPWSATTPPSATSTRRSSPATSTSGCVPRADAVRFASCSLGARHFAALVDGEVVRPLHDVAEVGAGTPAELLADPPVGDERVALADVKLRPVVPSPGKVVCMGLSYRAHVDEGVYDVPDYPVLFSKFAETLVAAGDPIVVPPESSAVDYEAELAFVIGRHVRRASGTAALEAVAGY